MKQSLLKALAALLLTGIFSQTVLAEAVHVTMRTNMGVIELELDKEKAPISVENFVNYAVLRCFFGVHEKIPFRIRLDFFQLLAGGVRQNAIEVLAHA